MTAPLHPAIAPLAQEIGQLPHVRRVLLFGSRARGDHRPRSDIDLAVEAPGADVFEWDRACALAENAATLLHIDLVRLEEANADFRDEILSEGLLLYERDDQTEPRETRTGA